MKNKIVIAVFLFLLSTLASYAERLVISGGEKYPLIHADVGKKQLHITVSLDTLCPKAQLHVVVKRNRGGKEVARIVKSYTGLKEKDLTCTVAFPEWGLYDYEVTLKNKVTGAVLATATSNIAIVPPREEAGPADFGVCTHFGHGKGSVPYSLDLIRLAGFTSIRDEIFWDAVEKKLGTFYFDPKYDKYVNAAVERDIRVLMLLDYGNPAPGEKVAHAGFPLDESGRRRFARYVKEMVTRYKDRIHLWELWNEPSAAIGIKPDTAYFELLKATYPVIKSIQPDGELICSGGAPNLVDGSFVNPIVKRGGAHFMDGFAMHTYVAPYTPEDGYATVGHAFLEQVSVQSLWPHYQKMSQRLTAEKSAPVDAWITEMGWHLADPFTTSKGENIMIDELRQAAYATRLFLLSRRYDAIRCVYLYDFQNDGTNPKEREHNFGTIRTDYSPKAAYVALAVLSHLLAEKPFSEAIEDTPRRKVFCYGEGEEKVIAFWSVNHYADPLDENAGNITFNPENKKGNSVTLDLGCKKIKLTDWQGQSIVLKSKEGKFTLPVTENPSFVQLLH